MAADFQVLPDEAPADTHALYAQLRRRCPVAHTDDLGGFWMLTRHADVARAAGDPATFTTTVQNVVPKVAFTGRRPPLHLDPPEHTPYRAALNPLLSAARVAVLEPVVRGFVRAALAPLLARGGGDLCGEFGALFPVQVFGHWMNLDGPQLEQLMTAGPAFIRSVQAFDNTGMKQTSLVLYDMARGVVAQRQVTPMPVDSDPVSALLAVRVDAGEGPAPLPADLIVGTVRQVLVVGIVAPMVMIGSIAQHLVRDPALHARLRADRALIEPALEEFLRLYSPYRGFARTAVRDVEIGGRRIPAGEAVAITYASANRDESVFDAPDEFRLHRPNIGEHLAFGRGPHFCAGAHLARLELRVGLEELLSSVVRFEPDGAARYCPYPEIGPYQLPMRFMPA